MDTTHLKFDVVDKNVMLHANTNGQMPCVKMWYIKSFSLNLSDTYHCLTNFNINHDELGFCLRIRDDLFSVSFSLLVTTSLSDTEPLVSAAESVSAL